MILKFLLSTSVVVVGALVVVAGVGIDGTAVVVVGGLVGGTSAPPLLITLTVVSSAFSVVVDVVSIECYK